MTDLATAMGNEPPRTKRKYTKRTKIDAPPQKREKRAAKAAPDRAWAFFLCEDDGLQMCPASGEGESLNLTAADALALAAFVDKHRGALEA